MTSQLIAAPVGSGYKQILLVGLGQREQHSAVTWQQIGGTAMKAANEHFKQGAVMGFDVEGENLAHLAYGAKLANYYFDKYYTDSQRKQQQAE